MKGKCKLQLVLVAAFTLGYFANVQAQKKNVTESIMEAPASVSQFPDLKVAGPLTLSEATVPASTTAAPTYVVVTVGYGGSKVQACDQIEGKFICTGCSFSPGTTVYFDPSLTYPITGTYIMYNPTGKIYNLSSGVIGTYTGNNCF